MAAYITPIISTASSYETLTIITATSTNFRFILLIIIILLALLHISLIGISFLMKNPKISRKINKLRLKIMKKDMKKSESHNIKENNRINIKKSPISPAPADFNSRKPTEQVKIAPKITPLKTEFKEINRSVKTHLSNADDMSSRAIDKKTNTSIDITRELPPEIDFYDITSIKEIPSFSVDNDTSPEEFLAKIEGTQLAFNFSGNTDTLKPDKSLSNNKAKYTRKPAEIEINRNIIHAIKPWDCSGEELDAISENFHSTEYIFSLSEPLDSINSLIKTLFSNFYQLIDEKADNSYISLFAGIYNDKRIIINTQVSEDGNKTTLAIQILSENQNHGEYILEYIKKVMTLS